MTTIKTQGDFSDLNYGDVVESVETVIGMNARMHGVIVNRPALGADGRRLPLQFALVACLDSVTLVTNRAYLRKVASTNPDNLAHLVRQLTPPKV